MFTAYESVDMSPHKLRYLIAGILVLANLLLLSIAVHVMHAHAASNGPSDSAAANPPADVINTESLSGSNAVAVGMGNMVNALNARVSATNQSIGSSLHTVSSAVGNGGKSIAEGTQSTFAFVGHGVTDTASFVGRGVATSATFVGRGIVSGVLFTGRSLGSGFAFMIRLPADILSPIAHTKVVSSVISPSEQAQAKAPVIDDNPAEVYAELAAVTPAVKTAVQQIPAPSSTPAPGTAPQWPLHGAITTLFGVPELPYERIHTGLDISDGTRPGTTPVHPFRPGIVEQTIFGGGLGNHVIIGHGGGIESVYGHLNSISVHVGQQIDENTIIGYEGTTGASTGTHLHFEIHVNGTPENPLNFIPGRP